MPKPTDKTLSFRHRMQAEAGLKPSAEEIEIEIRPGRKIIYLTSAPHIHLTNFLFQTIGMWLWKWSFDKDFEDRIPSDDLRNHIAFAFPPRMINPVMIGKAINCMRTKKARMQYGDFARPYGYKWDGPEDLATSMWLLAKTWIYETDVWKWNHNTSVAPGDGSRSAIEEELKEFDHYSSVVDAYYSQRRNAYYEWKTLSNPIKEDL